MANNTGNPIGSTASKDLSDNARNLDLLVLGDNSTYPDRKGVDRTSWKGMEREFNASQSMRVEDYSADKLERDSAFSDGQATRRAEFNLFLESSGYEIPFEYAPGVSITRVTQQTLYLGELYRAKSSALPFVTTAFAAEADKWISNGDNSLRQEMSDPAAGGAMLGAEKSLVAEPGTLGARLNDAFPAGYGAPPGAAVHIIAGIDSLSAGAGGSSYATELANDLRSVYGDHGPGFVPTDASVTGTGFWGSSSASQVADLSDSDIRRKMSFNFGGFYYDLMSAGQQVAWGPRRDWENIRLFFLKSPDGGKFKVDHGNVNSSTYRYEVDTYSPTYELGYIDITKRSEGTQDLLFLAGSVGAPGRYGKVCVYGGLITRKAAGPQVIVSRHAKGGYTVQQFVDILDDATQRQWFSLLSPTIYALNGGTNDAGRPAPITPAVLRVKMETLLSRLPVGTLKIMVAPNYHSGDISNVMPTYRPMIRQLAIDNGYGYINFAEVLGTSARAAKLGLMLDPTHPSQSGNKVLARVAGSYLGAAPALVRVPVTPFVVTAEGGGVPTVFRHIELSRKNLDRTAAGAIVLYDLGLISGFPIGMLDVQVTASRQDSLSVISQRLTARMRGGVAGSENLATCGTPTIVSILSDVQGGAPLTVALSLTQAGGRVQVVATCATGGTPDTYTNLCASGSVTLTQNVKTGKAVFEN